MEVRRGYMSEDAVVFENIVKTYPMYTHVLGGIKNMIFNFPHSFRALRRERFTALENVSFTVRRGEAVGIIGGNGAGKSTTLGLIAGVIKPDTGSVQTYGRISPFLELGAGFHPELSGRENMVLNGVLMGLNRKDVLERIEEIIEFAGIREFIDQPIRVYSSGMLARLGFSVVAHLDPKILLIDEVLAVGDISFQKRCIDKMNEFRNRGVTLIFVSHSMGEVKNVCDRVIWLADHTVRMTGESNDVVDAYINHQKDLAPEKAQAGKEDA